MWLSAAISIGNDIFIVWSPVMIHLYFFPEKVSVVWDYCSIKLKIDKKKIVMDDIKLFGSYICNVKVYPEITAKITVKVEE